MHLREPRRKQDDAQVFVTLIHILIERLRFFLLRRNDRPSKILWNFALVSIGRDKPIENSQLEDVVTACYLPRFVIEGHERTRPLKRVGKPLSFTDYSEPFAVQVC